jgi:hypothetical protein
MRHLPASRGLSHAARSRQPGRDDTTVRLLRARPGSGGCSRPCRRSPPTPHRSGTPWPSWARPVGPWTPTTTCRTHLQPGPPPGPRGDPELPHPRPRPGQRLRRRAGGLAAAVRPHSGRRPDLLAFLRFHNRVLADVKADLGPGYTARERFAEAQRVVRWHYQWLVLHQFLPTTVGQGVVDDVLANGPKHYRWRNDPFIPVEFSVAAYRFGHSQIRPSYRANFATSATDLTRQFFAPTRRSTPSSPRSCSTCSASPRASRPRWPPATCCATSPWRCRRASGWPGPCNCPSWPRPTSRTWSRCTWSGARRCSSTSCARPR